MLVMSNTQLHRQNYLLSGIKNSVAFMKRTNQPELRVICKKCHALSLNHIRTKMSAWH